MREIPNELRPDLLAIAALNPWAAHNSSPRAVMLGSHISQALVLHHATRRSIFTGVEREFGKATFKIKMPANAEVIKVVNKYPPSYEYRAIKENPLTTVIFEDVETRHIGIVDIPRINCNHQHFGFTYKKTAGYQRLSAGATIRKDTVLAQSPSITEDGDYCYGIESNVAYMSIPGVIEDGVVVSEDFAKRLRSSGFEHRTASWGKSYYPLNLYGDDEHYKPFPDIGEKIREDGLLFALREYNDLLAPVEMSPAALKTPNAFHDKLVYGKPGARVIDVTVRHANANNAPTPEGMIAQTAKYYQAELRYYNTLLDTYRELKTRYKRQGREIQITPEYHRLLVEAIAFKGDTGRNRSKQMYRLQELDDWRVDLTFEYDVEPGVGFKISGSHGNGPKVTGTSVVVCK